MALVAGKFEVENRAQPAVALFYVIAGSGLTD
jgi:hypothetical protein